MDWEFWKAFGAAYLMVGGLVAAVLCLIFKVGK